MRPEHSIHFVDVKEFLCDVLAKIKARAPGGDDEAFAARIRVGPHEVGQRPVSRNLLEALEYADLVQHVGRGGEAAVHAEDPVVYDRRDRQVIEHVHKVLPHVGAPVFFAALGIKAVDLRRLPRLVIPKNFLFIY